MCNLKSKMNTKIRNNDDVKKTHYHFWCLMTCSLQTTENTELFNIIIMIYFDQSADSLHDGCGCLWINSRSKSVCVRPVT